MEGFGLLRTLIEASGLPSELIEQELQTLIANEDLDPENLTLDNLRDLVATFLQDVLVAAKQRSAS